MNALLCKRLLRWLCLASLLLDCQQLSLPTDPTYKAGVVEYPPEVGTPRQRTMAALNGFMQLLESNETADLDIIVFPEYVLNSLEMASYVPQPSLKIAPCDSPDYDMLLVELSCAARARQLYVVLNLVEKERCAQGSGSRAQLRCPDSGLQHFNSNVVLDRQGRVISRYRKTHLWRYEYYSRSVLAQPELATFETDFGVTFGHFICFDMLFAQPALRLVRELNITDIIYPTFWFSELPFLTALQLQEGWAFANDVNLLAADGSDPAGRTTGSGIYAGRAGRLAAAILEQPAVLLLKADVPKRPLAAAATLTPKVVPLFEPQLLTPRYTQLATYRDYNLDIFSTQLLPADFLNVTQRLCHGADFCCDFSVRRTPIGQLDGHVAYRYRLGAYYGNGTTFLRVDRSGQAVCALFACTGSELLSCGRIFARNVSVANTHYFNHISVSGVFPPAARLLIMPSTVDAVMLPLPVEQYSWTEQTTPQGSQVQLQLTAPKLDLLTFGLWANYHLDLPSRHNLDHLQPGYSPAVAADVAAVAVTVKGAGAAAVPMLTSLLAGLALLLLG